MMVLELVAIAHAVLTDPQHGRRLCKPAGVNLCGDRHQFRLERDDVQWPRPRLAACTMRTTPGNAPSCELHVPLAPPLGRQPIPFWSKLSRWPPLPWTVFLLPYPMFSTPSGMIWLGSVLCVSHVTPQRRTTSASLLYSPAPDFWIRRAKCRGESLVQL
jgi:hypothetical protein